MALTEQQKKYGILGVGVVFVGWLMLRSKKASASEMPVVNVNVLPVPGAGGGMPSPTTTATVDAGTGTVIAGPTTPLVAPAPGAADTLHTVEKGESWVNLASRAYGDYRWWPYLWDYNSSDSTQFKNPDDLKRGASIKIPTAPPPDSAFKNAIFARAEAHRAYWVNKAKGGRPRPFPPEVLARTPLPAVVPPVEAPAKGVSGLACLGCGPGYKMQGFGRLSRR